MPCARSSSKDLPLYRFTLLFFTMYILDQRSITQHLLQLAERGNPTFTQKLHPGIAGVLGIRMADLRNLARKIVKSGTAENYLEQTEQNIATGDDLYMEARTLHGLVLGLIPPNDIEHYLMRVGRWVNGINSWSVCDAFDFSGRHGWVAKHTERIWNELKAWMKSSQEYEVRFGVVMGMRHFIDTDHVPELLSRYAKIKHEGYYVRMAVAWAVAECYLQLPEITKEWLQQRHLPQWSHNKAIAKIRESLRLSAEEKEMLLRWKY